jgi:WD40 repeat protein
VVASCGNDGKIYISHSKTGKDISGLVPQKVTGHPVNMLCVSFSSNSEHLACGTDDGYIQVWDLKERDFLFSINHSRLDQVHAVAWKEDDSIIVGVTSHGYLLIVDFKSQMVIKTLRYSDWALRTCKFSNFRRDLLACSGDEGVIIVFDVGQQEIYHAYEKSKHSKPCYGLAFSTTNELLLCSGGLDAKILFFDINEKKTVKEIKSHEPISCLSFYTDGVTIAAGTLSGNIYIYNLKDFKVKLVLKGHRGSEVRYLEFKNVNRKKSWKKGVTNVYKTPEEIKEEAKRIMAEEQKAKLKQEGGSRYTVEPRSKGTSYAKIHGGVIDMGYAKRDEQFGPEIDPFARVD